MTPVIEFIDMDREELNQLVERARTALSPEDYRKVKGMAEALTYVTDLVADQQTTIRDLRELIFPASTEKTEAVLKKAGVEPKSKPTKRAPRNPTRRNPSHPGMDGTGRKSIAMRSASRLPTPVSSMGTAARAARKEKSTSNRSPGGWCASWDKLP